MLPTRTKSSATLQTDGSEIQPQLRLGLAMRDGVELETCVWLPRDSDAPAPAILLRSPYDERIVTPAGMRLFVRYREDGFAVVFQLVRGVGRSGGTFSFNAPHERSDGYDTVEWIARQPWCDGGVGMDGSSYLAMMQLAAAVAAPPHLTCIVPTVPSADFFNEPPYFGGCFSRQHTLNWAHLISGAARCDLAPSLIGTAGVLGAPQWLERLRRRPAVAAADDILRGDKLAHYQDVLAHPDFDDWWRQRTLSATDYALISIPVLLIGGSFDIVTGCHIVWRELEAHGAPGVERQLLIGPWDHSQAYRGGSPAYGPYDLTEKSVVDLYALRLAFFRRHLMGADSPRELESRTNVFITGANRWLHGDVFPPPHRRTLPVFFHSGGHANGAHGDGTLSCEPPSESEPADRFSADPFLPLLPILSGGGAGPNKDLRERERYSETLVYTSAPLTEPLTLAGGPIAFIAVSANTPDCDLVVWLAEERADNQLVQLAFGAIRLRYREGFDREVLLRPGEPVSVRIPLEFVGHEVPAGSRLKVLVGGGLFPQLDPNPNTGEPIGTGVAMQIAEEVVHHDRVRASKLELPVLPRA